MKSIMFLGTSSSSGKTLISAVYCRYLHDKGLSVAPFKASGIAPHIHKSDKNRIMNMEQAIQAWASGDIPEQRMNPVLLKPGRSKTVGIYIDGVKEYTLSAGCRPDNGRLLNSALEAFDELSKEYDEVVCEGYGSPIDMNLYDDDIANMRMVTERDIPAVLVADIERGGVFAVIYGTWKLIPEKDRHHLKGYIINRFRGDESVLKDGIDRIEELTGLKCFGVAPYVNMDLPTEDVENIDDICVSEIDRILSIMKEHIDFEGLDSL